jgi:hypothetical protein
MWRVATGAAAVLFLCLSPLSAADERPAKGTIVSVDVNRGAVTVKVGDKAGREVEKTFRLGDRFQATDEAGKAVSIRIFRPGDIVRFTERDGKLRELRRERRAKRLERKEERKRLRDK